MEVSNLPTSEEFNMLKKAAEKLQPEDFLSSSKEVSKRSLSQLKSLYDFAKLSEKDLTSSSTLLAVLPVLFPSSKSSKKKKQMFSQTEVPLPNLIIDNFEEDQIWEEIQLQNGLIYETLVSCVSKILAQSNKPHVEVEDNESEEEDLLKELQENEIGIPEDEDEEMSDFFDTDKPNKSKQQKLNISYSKSIVDDKFFNLAQMTEFVDRIDKEVEQGQSEEQDKESEDEDSIDLFDENLSEDNEDEEEQDYYYKDFFDPPFAVGEEKNSHQDEEEQKHDDGEGEKLISNFKKSVRFNMQDKDEEKDFGENIIMNESDESEEQDENNLSTFEKKRRKIEKNIKIMEGEAIQPKSWHLTGEVTAQTRPENSLLEEHLIYDHLIRQAPEITMKTTQKLEDIIKQRIKDQAWDDVIRKIKPVEDASEYKKRLVLDAEKSKMSLTEIYEKEYIDKQQQNDGEAVEEKEPEEHKQIEKDMKSLFSKLDALSNFHYTPKAPPANIKVIRNESALTMEEVAQSAFSDATLLAPHEIQEPAKGEIKGKAERTSTDKKRERRLKKKKQHLKRLAQEEKARSRGLGLKNIKLADSVVKKSKKSGNSDEGFHNTKELKSSKAFFAKLQDQVSSHIDSVANRNKKSKDSKKLSAKKFKL